MDDLLIWWTTEQDCQRIGEPVRDIDWDAEPYLYERKGFVRRSALKLPEYIQKEYVGRFGRAGRGRLWVPDGIELKSIPWDDAKSITQLIASAGGIVFHRADLVYVQAYPGIITDTQLTVTQQIVPRDCSGLRFALPCAARELSRWAFSKAQVNMVVRIEFTQSEYEELEKYLLIRSIPINYNKSKVTIADRMAIAAVQSLREQAQQGVPSDRRTSGGA